MTPTEIYSSFRDDMAHLDAREVMELDDQLHENPLFAAEAGPEFVLAVAKGASQALRCA